MNWMNRCLAGVAGAWLMVTGLNAADMQPPAGALSNGVPIATMKNLDEIEPRTLITRLPFSISRSGSYYVSAPLPGTNGANGIVISVGDVIIDLNGFTLRGTNGSLDGIRVTVPCDGLTIRNGSIYGWGGYGIMATNAAHVRIEGVNVTRSGSGGIYAGKNALVERCEVYANGFDAPPSDPPADDGIHVRSYSTIKDCKAFANRGAGIHSYQFSQVIGCIATESMQADGIHVEDFCTVQRCTAARNMENGIKVGSMSRVSDNICGQNGTSSTNGAGILVVGQNSMIDNNNCCGNYYGYKTHMLTADGNLYLRNNASNNSNDYYFVAGDYYGQVLTPPPGSIINSNPWANFSTF